MVHQKSHRQRSEDLILLWASLFHGKMSLDIRDIQEEENPWEKTNINTSCLRSTWMELY